MTIPPPSPAGSTPPEPNPSGGAWGSGPTQPTPSFGGPPPPGPTGPGQSVQDMSKGLLGSLFDFSFRHFATPHIVRIVYVLVTVALGIAGIGMLITALGMMGNRQAGAGFALLILTPILMLIYLALARMTMELYIAVCRTAEEASRIRDLLERR